MPNMIYGIADLERRSTLDVHLPGDDNWDERFEIRSIPIDYAKRLPKREFAKLYGDFVTKGNLYTSLEIQLEAHGDRLRYWPRSAVTPDVADRIKTHKGDLLAILRSADAPQLNSLLPIDAMVSADARCPDDSKVDHAGDDQEAQSISCARCGSSEFRDVPIHGGRSMRRDCARCQRFVEFTVWCGTNRSGSPYTGQIDQQRQ